MAKDESWKGEHLIRKSVTTVDHTSETKRIVSKIYHNNRRAAGAPAPAAKKHKQFVLAVWAGNARE